MLKLLKVNPEAVKLSPAPDRQITYIVIHYTGGSTSRPGYAVDVSNDLLKTDEDRSVDFIVDDAIAVQFNPDISNRFSWHCGSGQQKDLPEEETTLSELCGNKNSIGVEIASSNHKCRVTYAGDPDYYFTEEVLNNAAVLIKSLMTAYDIDISRVIRHYDVSGKKCPGVAGWYGPENSSANWLLFKEKITAAVLETDQTG